MDSLTQYDNTVKCTPSASKRVGRTLYFYFIFYKTAELKSGGDELPFGQKGSISNYSSQSNVDKLIATQIDPNSPVCIIIISRDSYLALFYTDKQLKNRVIL